MRSRNIKPGFFDNEKLATFGPCVQILFEGLWCLADREGRLEDRPLRIKAKIFPYYQPYIGITVDPPLDNGGYNVIERMLQLLESKSFIMRYDVSGNKYIQINKFLKHQSPHKSERRSEIPEIKMNNKNNGEITVDPPLDNGGSRPDCLIPDSLIPDSKDMGEIPPEQKKPKKEKSKIPKFIIPTIEEISAYCSERKNKVCPEKFFNFYNSKGWMVGKNKMKNWKSSVITWETNGNGKQTGQKMQTGNPRVFKHGSGYYGQGGADNDNPNPIF